MKGNLERSAPEPHRQERGKVGRFRMDANDKGALLIMAVVMAPLIVATIVVFLTD